MDLKEESILGNSIASHWYYQSKAQALESLIGSKQYNCILDVGAGSGYFTKYLLLQGAAHRGICVDLAYDRESEIDNEQFHLEFHRELHPTDAELILLMDVIEHVDSDTDFLRKVLDNVSQGSTFIISVPAFEFLWSDHDEFLGHKRRYTINQLRDVIYRAGELEIDVLSYYFGNVFPIAVARRITKRVMNAFFQRQAASDLTIHHPLVNKILLSLCALELKWFPRNKLMGLTVFCKARKQ